MTNERERDQENEEEATMADTELMEMMKKEVRVAMYHASKMTRDECVKYVRQFGGRISNEDLASLVERMPLAGEAP